MTYRSLLLLAATVALVCGCGTPHKKGGLGKPTIYTSVKSYLDTVGLDRYDKQDVLERLGVPDGKASEGGRELWSYDLADTGASYVYIFEDGTLHNVRFNGAAPYNGMNARERQDADGS